VPFDPKRLSQTDWAIVGGGAVALLSTFMPWFGVHVLGVDVTVSGWRCGFIGWFGALLLAAAAVYVAMRRSDLKVPELPLSPAVVPLGLAALGLVFVVWRWLTMPRAHISGLASDYGPRFGIWLAIIAGAVEVGGAVMQFRASGEKLPWQKD
jgi:hypothetical protein